MVWVQQAGPVAYSVWGRNDSGANSELTQWAMHRGGVVIRSGGCGHNILLFTKHLQCGLLYTGAPCYGRREGPDMQMQRNRRRQQDDDG